MTPPLNQNLLLQLLLAQDQMLQPVPQLCLLSRFPLQLLLGRLLGLDRLLLQPTELIITLLQGLDGTASTSILPSRRPRSCAKDDPWEKKYIQFDSISLGFDEISDAGLLFFDHGCELLHQGPGSLLPLLGLGEARLEPTQLCSHLITNLLHLQKQSGDHESNEY
ncbi:hypothetical protein EYF80_034326 [Liparis tanakae]|uniref:Uncharacterized protein n=1 Tax=Liparis tanakae TaxID=230148 RepID=A0A4Z2GRZ5_9TELE|nr:hypothetical protein EYF80_034326 [Liparis tanakae]